MIKRSVAILIRDPSNPGRILGVRRPPDDDELPNAWGLPAGSLGEGESWQDAARRAGREKLGVELDVGDVVEAGTLVRADYMLHMQVFEARIVEGEPRVPQDASGVTQYSALEWATADRFEPAAKAGSLCCQLYLRSISA